MERAGYLRDHLVISGFRVTPVVGFVRAGFTCNSIARKSRTPSRCRSNSCSIRRNHLPRARSFAGVEVLTHEIPYQGRHIWGATASMLISFGRLLQDAP